jgi:hypothetical protein
MALQDSIAPPSYFRDQTIAAPLRPGVNKDTAAERESGAPALPGGGASGLPRRTYRRAYPPPNGLSRIYDDLGPPSSGHIVAVSIPGSLLSHGAAIRAIRPPQGVMEDLPKSSRRPHPLVEAVRALRALREVQYHRNATLPGLEENR